MLILINKSDFRKIPSDIYKKEDLESNPILETKADYYGGIVAETLDKEKFVVKLTNDNENLLEEISEENILKFEKLNIDYILVTDLENDKYIQLCLQGVHEKHMDIKSILKEYLRLKIDNLVGDPLDLLTDLKNTQFFFQSLSARYIAISMRIHQKQLIGETPDPELITEFNQIVEDYLPFTTSYTQMIDNDMLERTADLKNRWLTRDGQIMKYITREKVIYELVYSYNKSIGNNVGNL